MRIGVVAGEASGDQLAASVLEALRQRRPGLVLEGIGGPELQRQGLSSLVPMERLSVMGFVEPFKRLPELFRIRRHTLQYFCDNPPDLFLGVDSPDFNLGLERKLRRRGIATAHLVSPSVWAWRPWRIRGISRSVDLMLCLFPFETQIYRDYGVPARFVGHPLAQELSPVADGHTLHHDLGLTKDAALIALLPGSREQEIRYLAPVFLQAARLIRAALPEVALLIPAANRMLEQELAQHVSAFPELNVHITLGRSRELIAASDAVLLASGTATLEAALLGRPMVVAYRMSPVSWQLIKRMVKTRFASLPNIISGSALVPEFLQDAASPEALSAAVLKLMREPEAVAQQQRGFQNLRQALGTDFGGEVAEALLGLLQGQTNE
ncbi:MAG: lipid-A-disaccharide synthase [Pseudomonadota bacterium]